MRVERLAAYLEGCASQPARLGHLDCVRFVAGGLVAGWDRDFHDLLGYEDRRSAVARLRKAGGLYAAISTEFGPPVPAEELKPGDIAYYADPAIGLVLPNCCVLKIYRTIARVPRSSAACGWPTGG